MLDDCNPLVCSPTSPGLPFGTWYLALFDSLRLVTVLVAFGLLFATGVAWARSVPRGGQRDRYLALAIFAIIIVGTELQNVGNIASYRLVLSLVGIVFALRGLVRFKYEQPSQPNSRADE